MTFEQFHKFCKEHKICYFIEYSSSINKDSPVVENNNCYYKITWVKNNKIHTFSLSTQNNENIFENLIECYTNGGSFLVNNLSKKPSFF